MRQRDVVPARIALLTRVPAGGVMIRTAAVLTMLVASLTLPLERTDAVVRSARHLYLRECPDQPRSPAELSAILALDREGVPARATTRLAPPLGELADPATSAAITTATRQVLACVNFGDIPRAAALMTDVGVQRVYGELTADAASRARLQARLETEPEARPHGRRLRVLNVAEATVLPDGRVAAFAVLKEPLITRKTAVVLVVVFAKQDDRWLLDDIIDFAIVPSGEAGEAVVPTR